MNKESIIELQKLDCNCNDCYFQVRDSERFKQSLELHKKWQLDYFNVTKENILIKAEKWKSKGEPEKAERLKKEASKIKFQFDKKEASINYGHCSKFDKKISWIPNTLQLETQDCFRHRKEI